MLLLEVRFYANDNFLQVISYTVGVNKARVSRAVFSPGKPFENKNVAQFYDVK